MAIIRKYRNTKRLTDNYKNLLRQDLSGLSVIEIESKLKEVLGPLPQINWPINKSFSVIRARYVDPDKEDITDPATFAAPPSHKTDQGRANIEHHPAFYGSFDARTAMQEIKVPKNTECYVSIWEFKTKPPTLTTFLSRVEAKNHFASLYDNVPIVPPKNLEDIYTRSSFKRAMQLRAKLFTSPGYEVTSRIAHNINYNKSAQSDGILYPSVIDPYQCNVALSPKFAEQHMECVLVVRQVWSGAFIFRTLGGAEMNGAKLDWKGVQDFDITTGFAGKYMGGGRGPTEIHPSALEVLKE